MKTTLIAISLLVSTYSFSQSKIGSKDPCYVDNSSVACQDKISKQIFFMTSVNGTIRPEESAYVYAYFDKYGLEGFKVPASQYHPGSLLVYTLDNSVHSKFNKKLIMALPKGGSVDGKNIFDLVIKDHPPFKRESILKVYISNLNLLFPVDGNEDFQKTKDLFGLPWEDPLFPDKYVERIQSMVSSIDESNDFFKKNDFQREKKEFLEIIARVKKLQDIPAKACAVNLYEEFIELNNKYGNILSSPRDDTIGCMIKAGKFELVQKIIENAGCDDPKLASYFDLAVGTKETPESFKLSQFLYRKLSLCGMKIKPVKGEEQRDFLQRGSVYLHKYHQEEIVCDTQIHAGTTIDDLSKNLDQVLYAQAYQLVEKLLIEKDATKKAELFEQFISLKNVGINLPIANPNTGKTILHLIAEAGDYELLSKLDVRGVHPIILGIKVLDRNGKTPLTVAIEAGGVKHLKFATGLLKIARFTYNYEDLKTIKKELRNLKTDNKDTKEYKKSLLWDIKEMMFDD